MKTLGIGVDICENSRIKKLINNKLFLRRIFTNDEIVKSNIKNKTLYYAKRFAAKEAFAKALGIGFRQGLNFKDISIINDKLGKPSFIITSKIKSIIKKKYNLKNFNLFLSISDEKKYSIAFVLFEKK
mgnify:CR=1 FL=1